jgi:proline racemase
MSPRLLVEVLIFLKREDLLVGVEVNCLTTFSFFITFRGDFWSFVDAKQHGPPSLQRIGYFFFHHWRG